MAAFGLEPWSPLSAYESRQDFRFHARTWTVADGLPQNSVRCLLQSRDGYLWIGTRHGLSRFDGIHFRKFVAELALDDSPDLDVQQLAEDAQGLLWVRTPDGLLAFDGIRFRPYGGPEFSHRKVFDATPHRKGGLWLTGPEGLTHFEDGRVVRRHVPPPRIGRKWISAPVEDEHGRVWVHLAKDGESPFWYRLDPDAERWESLAGVIGRELPHIGRVLPDRHHRIWVSTANALYRWDGKTLERFEGAPNPGAVLVETAEGMIILGDGKVSRFAEGKFAPLDDLAIPGGYHDARSALVDRERNVWIGHGHGLSRLHPHLLSTWQPGNSLGSETEITSVREDKNGALWAGSWRGLLYLIQGQWQVFEPDLTNRHFRRVSGVAPVLLDAGGNVWVGVGEKGLREFRDGSFYPVLMPGLPENEGWQVTTLNEDLQGRLWVGTARHGLFVRKDRSFERFDLGPGLEESRITGVCVSPGGTVWVGALGGGLLEFGPGGSRRHTTANGLQANEAVPLTVDAQGALWIATRLGLNRFLDGRFAAVTVAQGLFDDFCYALLDDGLGYFWSYGNRGIYRLRQEHLNAVADGQRKRLDYVSFSESDGMVSAEGNGEVTPNATRLRDGRLCFPTTRGIAVVDPKAIAETEVRPHAILEQVSDQSGIIYGEGADAPPPLDAGADSPAPLRLRPGRARILKFTFTSSSLTFGERNRFRCRLRGVDADWRPAAPERVAFYNDLRPASYVFEVEASDHRGVWSVEPAVFRFTLAPSFVQTVWFPVSATAGGALLVLGFIRWRLGWQRRVLRAEQAAALAAERARFARDLHDDFGASLAGLALQSELLQNRPGAPSAELATLSETLRQLGHEVREIAWAANPRCDDGASLAAFAAEQARRFCAAAGLELEIDFARWPEDSRLPGPLRHDLLLAIKEALANIQKHAQARHVSLSLSLESGRIHLAVRDDGIGFDTAARASGLGLDNLRQRFQAAGGTFQIESASGRGTALAATLPLPANPNL